MNIFVKLHEQWPPKLLHNKWKKKWFSVRKTSKNVVHLCMLFTVVTLPNELDSFINTSETYRYEGRRMLNLI